MFAAIVIAVTSVVLSLYWAKVPKKSANLGSLDENDLNNPFNDSRIPGGAFVELPYGRLRYYLFGPENGKKIVLIHGIGFPTPLMPDFVNALAAKGYRVLAFDLYGRSLSDSPGVDYNLSFYISTLAMLLYKVGWDKSKINVLGTSLGGAIAVGFAATFPEKIDHLLLCAPAGLLESLPPITRILSIPIFGELFFYLFGGKILYSRMVPPAVVEKGGIHATENEKRVANLYLYQVTKHPGFLRAYYSTLKSSPLLSGMHNYFSKVGAALGDRILIVWGTADTITPFPLVKEAKELMPKADVVVLDNASHGLWVDHVDETLNAITGYMKKHK